jgi:hypothetical protein
MPRPLIHFLGSILVLAYAGFLCGLLGYIAADGKMSGLIIETGFQGAWYCLITHGTELSVATMIYCWLFYRKGSSR